MSLRRVFRVLTAQWWVVALVAVLGAGIAVGAAEWRNRTITPQFEATAPVAVLRLSDESDDRFNRR
ncbi:MAG: Wzz/FepE/Etk N-terminal domain-containing protein, partial [Acidimicrobiia bacterium]